jgi:hypothetical protein
VCYRTGPELCIVHQFPNQAKGIIGCLGTDAYGDPVAPDVSSYYGIVPDGVASVKVVFGRASYRATVTNNFWLIHTPDTRSYPRSLRWYAPNGTRARGKRL